MKKEPAPSVGFARKYRPQQFDDVVGQEAVTVTLKNALASGTPAHAYLFFGPRGIGKTTTARILAKSLNCAKGPTAEPCGKCSACDEITRSAAIDVLELDAATHTQVEKIREMIIETVGLAPSRDRFKVFIIDEVHMLSGSSFNALLKTLEEPPAHVVFILATTEPAKIPATIVSRCQRFRFRPVPVNVLTGHLGKLAKAEKIKAEPAALEHLARAAGGSLRDAVSLLDQANAFADDGLTAKGVTELLGTLPEEALLALTGALLAKDPKALADRMGAVLEEGYDPAQLVRDLRERLHQAFLSRLGVPVELETAWKKLADAQSAETFSYLVTRLNRTLEQMRGEDSPRLALEQGLFGALEAAYDLSQWVERLESLEKRLGSGGGGPPPAAAPRTAPVAAPAPAAAPVTRPPLSQASAAPALPGPAENVWPAVIQQFRTEKPLLAQALEGARLVPGAADDFKLLFKRPFELQQAQRQQAAIEAKMTTILGRKARLTFEIGAGKSTVGPSTDVVEPDTAPAEAAEDAPAGTEEGAPQDPGIKRVLEVFPGKVRHLKKKPS